LQDPVIYTSGTSIPYTVTLSSPGHTSVPASLDIEVQLIKVTETFISRKREEVKKLLADGQNLERRDKLGAHRRTNTDGTEPQNGATVIIKGAIQAGSEGGEMSWKIENVVAVKVIKLWFIVLCSDRFHAVLPSLRCGAKEEHVRLSCLPRGIADIRTLRGGRPHHRQSLYTHV
jgi:hypothetical protein